MRKFNKLTYIFSVIVTLQLLAVTDGLAFRERGGFDRSHRGFSRDRSYHRDAQRSPSRQHEQDVHQRDTHTAVDQNSLAHAHDEHAPTFSQQHLTMNPHQGIPNNSFKNMNTATHNDLANHNWQNNNSNWNGHNNWNNSNWNNNNWNHNWGLENNWSNVGWNNNLFTGVLAGVSVGTLFATYALLKQPMFSTPYYNNLGIYPSTVNTPTSPSSNNVVTPNNTTTPSNESWVSAKDGNFPDNSVVNNTENGKSTYYCRTTYMNKLNYGVLVPHDGCYIETPSVTMRFTTYETLIRQ
ncbi:MAG: hypothetical protein P4M12_04375 [Gammaproteobacteria bacterium]|nr:hypothetical protein [Gammaproteobacteria bacterium]